MISEHFQIDLSSDIHETTWVKHNGIEYYTGLVVCTDVVNDMPVFMKIICIFLQNYVFFLVSEMETVFVEHFHAFRVVDNTHNVSVVRPHDLRYFKPFDVQRSYGSDLFLYIVPDSCIVEGKLQSLGTIVQGHCTRLF